MMKTMSMKEQTAQFAKIKASNIKSIYHLIDMTRDLEPNQKMLIIRELGDEISKHILSPSQFVVYIKSFESPYKVEAIASLQTHFSKIFVRPHHVMKAITEMEEEMLLPFCQLIAPVLKEKILRHRGQCSIMSSHQYFNAHLLKIFDVLSKIKGLVLNDLFSPNDIQRYDEHKAKQNTIHAHKQHFRQLFQTIVKYKNKEDRSSTDIQPGNEANTYSNQKASHLLKEETSRLSIALSNVESSLDCTEHYENIRVKLELALKNGLLKYENAYEFLVEIKENVDKILKTLDSIKNLEINMLIQSLKHIRAMHQNKCGKQEIEEFFIQQVTPQMFLNKGEEILFSGELFWGVSSHMPRQLKEELFNCADRMSCKGKSGLLNLAFQFNDIERFNLLLKKGANPNTNYSSNNGIPLLIEAILTDNRDQFVTSLLKYGAEPDNISYMTYNKTFGEYVVPNVPLNRMIDFLKRGESTRAIFRQLLEHGVSPNLENILLSSHSLLSAAAYVGNEYLIDLLIEYGANINYIYPSGNNLLIKIFSYVEHAGVQRLLDKGVEIHQVDDEGSLALFLAYNSENYEDFRILANAPGIGLDKKRVVYIGEDEEECEKFDSRTLLMQAYENDDQRYFDLLLEKGADMSIKFDDGLSLIMVASRCINSFEKLKKLLEVATSDVINAVDNQGNNALFYAIYNGNEQAVKLLLGKDISLTAINNKGYRSFEYVFHLMITGQVRQLLKNYHRYISLLDILFNPNNNPNIAALGHDEEFPLHFLLKIKESDFSKLAKHKNPVLRDAVLKQFKEDKYRLLNKFLKDNPGYVDANYKNGKTALNYACSYNETTLIIKILVDIAKRHDKPKYVNKADDEGRTALISLVCNGHNQQSHIRTLLKYGADIYQQDRFGKSALDYAGESSNEIIIKLFEKALPSKKRKAMSDDTNQRNRFFKIKDDASDQRMVKAHRSSETEASVPSSMLENSGNGL